jgi:purine-binding chemotaxis protein CheW
MADTQVLEFRLGTSVYCIDIGHVEEVVAQDSGSLTPLPNAESHVEGIMDLRGQTTRIVDPSVLLGVDRDRDVDRIVVLEAADDAGGSVGWQVDEVCEVSTVAEDAVEQPTDGDALVRGVINDGDEFVIWVEP